MTFYDDPDELHPDDRPDERPKALGCHIFGGSFSAGVREYFDILAHLENSDYGVETARQNLDFEHGVYQDPETWPLEKFKDVDFVYGNPPCAPFSTHGFHAGNDGWLDDERIDCIAQIVDLAAKLRPRFLAFESIVGAFRRGRPLIRDAEEVLHAQGYNITHWLHDTHHYGAPQTRKRYFMVAHLPPIDWQPPEWRCGGTIGDWLEAYEDRKDPAPDERTEPVSDDIISEWNKLFPDLDQGQYLIDLWEERNPNTKRGRPRKTVRRLDPESPAWTVIGCTRFIHPTEDRALTVDELASLHGYPEGWTFDEDNTPHQKSDLVARGVHTCMGERLARRCAEAIGRSTPPDHRGTWFLDYRKEPGHARLFEHDGSESIYDLLEERAPDVADDVL